MHPLYNLEDIMAKVVTATDLRAKAREVIQSVQFQGDHVIVTVFDKPAVAIISIDDYRDYLACKQRQQQGKGQLQAFRRTAASNTTLEELTDEELQVIIEGVHNAGQIDGHPRAVAEDGQHQR
jgi:prevent-host-death family protein